MHTWRCILRKCIHGDAFFVEAAIQLAHDLDETGMPCVCIGVGLLGVLLDLPERI